MQDATFTSATDAVELAVGEFVGVDTTSFCVRTGRGLALCGGRNGSGQLGNGTLDCSPGPVAVRWSATLPMHDVRDVACGPFHRCAVLADGTAACWGQNDLRQLGLETGGAPLRNPSDVFPVPAR